jgi:predicted ferric reductase
VTVKTALGAITWVTLYLVLCLLPLLIVLTGDLPLDRPFVVDFSVALGFVGLSMMCLQFALVARYKTVAAPFGIDALMRFHKQITWVALSFVIAHPVLLFVEDPDKYLRLLNVFTAPWRARFAVASVVLLLLLVGLSIYRLRLKLSYEAWQLTHGILAVAVVVFALMHMNGVGRFMSGVTKDALVDTYVGLLVFLLVWVRIVAPLRRLARPWRLTRVEPELGDSATMVIEPVGHEGFSFDPGQFGWIIVDRSPFALTHHPFSFSSSGDVDPGGEVALTVKANGDFSASIPDQKPGVTVYVDGPHGVFSMERYQAMGYVFIAGGVGITPLMSMIRTMHEREDTRPVVLFCSNKHWDDVTFRDELAALDETMPNLTVVHVLGDAPDGWTGETGRLNAEILRRHLPRQYRRFEFFVCGPNPMMDAMEDALVSIGVAFSRVNTERFNFV